MIGANNDHPYKAVHNQLEMILIHIDAAFEFNSWSVEFGLQKKKIVEHLNDAFY